MRSQLIRLGKFCVIGSLAYFKTLNNKGLINFQQKNPHLLYLAERGNFSKKINLRKKCLGGK